MVNTRVRLPRRVQPEIGSATSRAEAGDEAMCLCRRGAPSQRINLDEFVAENELRVICRLANNGSCEQRILGA
jgi:hypothetical protein